MICETPILLWEGRRSLEPPAEGMSQGACAGDGVEEDRVDEAMGHDSSSQEL